MKLVTNSAGKRSLLLEASSNKENREGSWEPLFAWLQKSAHLIMLIRFLWALAVKLDRDRNEVVSCHAGITETVVSKDAKALWDRCFPPTAEQIHSHSKMRERREEKWHCGWIAFRGTMLCLTVPDCTFPYYNPDTGFLLIHGHRCPVCIANIATLPPPSSLESFRDIAYFLCHTGHELELGYWACSQGNWCKLSPALSCGRWNWYFFLCSALITQGWVTLILKMS